MATEIKDVNERAKFYKKPIKRDNYKLNADNIDTPQEVRRQRLLQFQKKCRDAAFNAGRGILEEAFNSEDECEDGMEVDQTHNKRFNSYKRERHHANQLMMSEWMHEVPQDLIDKWILVPCPQGKRTLVVACKGATKAYDKRGNRLGKFHSALPGGNPSEYRNSCTIIDCLWMKQEKTYFVLDVLAWSNQSLLNCDTEFRFFWLKSQLHEIEELRERDTYKNTFPILALPNISCDSDINLSLANLTVSPPLDGLLFYHRDGHYTKGRTPLVTWLKPFMLPEVLGIAVPAPLDEKPIGYIDLKYYILNNRAKKKKEASENHMEIVDENC